MQSEASVVAVLDDEPEMRKALRRLLLCRKYAVEEFASGEEFLASLATHQPGCLLLDLQMPGINGFGVLEAFQSRHIHVPVVVITAHDDAGTAERVSALGASAYLKKPVDRATLLAAIEAVLSPGKTSTVTNGYEPNHQA
jgi:FixJ family two-component response regulator